jgi:hypothetical protein
LQPCRYRYQPSGSLVFRRPRFFWPRCLGIRLAT